MAIRQEYQARIVDLKKTTPIDELCGGMPKEFATYFEHIKSNDNDDPDYAFLRKQFQQCYRRHGFKKDNVYDWTMLKFNMALAQGTLPPGLLMECQRVGAVPPFPLSRSGLPQRKRREVATESGVTAGRLAEWMIRNGAG